MGKNIDELQGRIDDLEELIDKARDVEKLVAETGIGEDAIADYIGLMNDLADECRARIEICGEQLDALLRAEAQEMERQYWDSQF